MTETEDKKRICWICRKEHPNVYEAFGCLNSHEEVGKNISGAEQTKSIEHIPSSATRVLRTSTGEHL